MLSTLSYYSGGARLERCLNPYTHHMDLQRHSRKKMKNVLIMWLHQENNLFKTEYSKQKASRYSL